MSAIFCVSIAAPAYSQYLRDERVLLTTTVDQRIPPELRTDTLHYKGFIYKPSITAETLYDSNVLASSDNEESDVFVKVTPELFIKKSYDNHNFGLRINSDVYQYLSLTDENHADFNAEFQAVLNSGGALQIPISARYTLTAQERDTPQVQGATQEPENIRTYLANAGVIKKFNRLSLGVIGEYEDVAFDDGVSASTGAPILYSSSDRKKVQATLSARYAFPGEKNTRPRHTAYIEASHARQTYTNNTLNIDRDQDISGIVAGLETDYKGLLFANIGGGYRRYSYDDPTLDAVGLINVKARVEYNMLPKLTLKLDLSSRVNQDNGFTQGIRQYSAKFGADYELKHNLYLGSDLEYTSYDYIDNVRGKEDDIKAGLNLKYLHSRHINSKASVVYQDRAADDPRYAFDRLIFMLGLTYTF